MQNFIQALNSIQFEKKNEASYWLYVDENDGMLFMSMEHIDDLKKFPIPKEIYDQCMLKDLEVIHGFVKKKAVTLPKKFLHEDDSGSYSTIKNHMLLLVTDDNQSMDIRRFS